MPILARCIALLSCRADSLEAALVDRSSDPCDKGSSLNVHVAGALVAYQVLLGRR